MYIIDRFLDSYFSTQFLLYRCYCVDVSTNELLKRYSFSISAKSNSKCRIIIYCFIEPPNFGVKDSLKRTCIFSQRSQSVLWTRTSTWARGCSASHSVASPTETTLQCSAPAPCAIVLTDVAHMSERKAFTSASRNRSIAMDSQLCETSTKQYTVPFVLHWHKPLSLKHLIKT